MIVCTNSGLYWWGMIVCTNSEPWALNAYSHPRFGVKKDKYQHFVFVVVVLFVFCSECFWCCCFICFLLWVLLDLNVMPNQSVASCCFFVIISIEISVMLYQSMLAFLLLLHFDLSQIWCVMLFLFVVATFRPEPNMMPHQSLLAFFFFHFLFIATFWPKPNFMPH